MCPKTPGLFVPKLSLPRCQAISTDTPSNVHHLLKLQVKAFDYKTGDLIVSYTGPGYVFIAEGYDGDVLCTEQIDHNGHQDSYIEGISSIVESQISSEVWLEPDDNIFLTPPQEECQASFDIDGGSQQTVAVQESYIPSYDQSAPIIFAEMKEFNISNNEVSPILKDNDIELAKDCSVLLSQLSNEIVYKRLSDVQNDINEYSNTEYTNNPEYTSIGEFNSNNDTHSELLHTNKPNEEASTPTILYYNENTDYGHDLQYINPKNFEFTNDDVSKYMEDSLDDIPLTAYVGSSNTENASFTCQYCEETFTTLAKQKEHLKTNHDNKRSNTPYRNNRECFNCEECNRKFSSRQRWISHSRAHEDPDLVCSICLKVLGSKQSLKGHMRIHARKFKCDFCQRTYETETTMRSHILKKHGPIKCKKCVYESFSKEEHNLHKESHQAIANIPGFEAVVISATEEGVNIEDDHLIEENNVVEVNNPIEECNITNEEYNMTEEHLEDTLLDNILEDDIIDPSPEDDFFPTYFADEEEEDPDDYDVEDYKVLYDENDSITKRTDPTNTLIDHDTQDRRELGTAYDVVSKIITVETKYKKKIKRDCIMCNKHFDRTSDFKRHIIEHVIQETRPTTDKSRSTPVFRCQLCEKGQFSRVDKLKAHLRHHLKLRLYQCHLCNKTFSDSSNYSKHKKVHGSKVLYCDICKRKFNTKKMIAQHMEYHNKTKPLYCKECGKVFYFMSNLKKHYNINHKIKGRGSHSCQICHTKFKSMKLKWDHQWEVHSLRKNVIDCQMCTAMFRKYSELKRHAKDKHGVNMCTRDKYFNLHY